jgi:aspartyl-tRNA(Asn)/glutamyl-tRNA(Gln) amidotransferase subunit A
MNTLVQSAGARAAPQSLARLTTQQIFDGYRSGHFTPRDVIDEVIAALETTDARCKVIATEMFASARAEADRATAAWKNGEAKALTGVPITIKDLIYVAGTPANGGAPMLDGFVPDTDSAVVTAVKAAGAIVTCKTTTCESGYKLTADSPVSGITRNPWSLGRTSGGSSGGAAAAVAAGCGPLAIGTDGVGSIRVPSSFCGVFGLKPTFGLVPRSPGFFPPSWPSLAHTGPIARTVADAALLLEIIAGYDARDPGSLQVARRSFAARGGRLNGLRIGSVPISATPRWQATCAWPSSRRSIRSPTSAPTWSPTIRAWSPTFWSMCSSRSPSPSRPPPYPNAIRCCSCAPRRNIAPSSPRAAPIAASTTCAPRIGA